MSQNRIIIFLSILMAATFAKAGVIDSLHQALASQQGKDRIITLGQIFQISQSIQDTDAQYAHLNELLNECRRQKDDERTAQTLNERITWFYNNDYNDSVYKYKEKDLEFMRHAQQWRYYYGYWCLAANTYVYDGKLTIGLKEAEKLYADAKERSNSLGMGLGYYALGNAYYALNDMEETTSAYKKSIDLLLHQKPLPVQLTEIFSSQTEALERTQDYKQMDKSNAQWREYIDLLMKEYGVEKDHIGLFNIWAYYYISCSQADMGQERYDAAAEHLGKARDYILSDDDKDNLFRTWMYYRTRLCMLRNFWPEALVYSNKLMQMAEANEDKTDMVNYLKQRAEIMLVLGRYTEASELYKKMYEITDSINGYETKKSIAEMNTIMRIDEIKVLEERQRANQQRLGIIIISTIIVLSLGIFLLFRIRAARKLKKAHHALEDAHSKLEETHSKLEETHQQLLTAYDQLEETTIAKERIESDLRIAREIQMSMVPHNFPDRPDLDLYASMTPAKEVGGDLYGYHLAGDKLYFCLGDVSGKGVPASLFMAQATRLFRTLAAQKLMPADIATQINAALSGEDNERSMFVTMFIGLIDLTNGHLDFCNAGHNPPVLIDEGTTEFIDMIPNAPIGLWPDLEYEGEEIADISDKPLFVYTDGLNEAENRQQEQFTDEKLLELLQTRPFVSCEQTVEMLRDEVEKHRDGAEPNDDLTMLCVKVKTINQ